MILEIDHWCNGYNQIREDCLKEQSSVLLVVSATCVDAVCAARMWAYWLRADGISYEVMAANQYRSICDRLVDNSTGQQYGACVLLGMGATVNLTRMMAGAPCKIYVSDGRRPVHLANIHSSDNIVVFWDDMTNDQEIPSDGDNLSGNESSSDEESEDSDEEDEFEEDDDSAKEGEDEDEGEHEFQDDDAPAKNPVVHDESAEYDGEDEMDEQDDFDPDNPANDGNDDDRAAKKRRRLTTETVDTAMTEETQESEENASATSDHDETQTEMQSNTQNPLTPREMLQQRRAKLQQYYAGGTFYGSPSSFVAWQVSSQTRHASNPDLLWLAMLGVTASFQLHQLDVVGYSQLAMALKESCEAMFPNDALTRVQQQVPIYAEHLTSTSSGGDERVRTKIGVSQNGRILSENDFRFFLLRHSSLYQSIMHSDYVATKLQLTTPAGHLKLKEWLATMGFSLADCQQPYGLMKPSLRRRLQESVLESAAEFGLDEIQCTGFFRVTGFQSLLSASDASHAVAALLALTPISSKASGDVEDSEDSLQRAFQSAYDALNFNGNSGDESGHSMSALVEGTLSSQNASSGIPAGFHMAKTLQQNILSTAASLMERKAITRLTHFRYAFITSSNNVGAPGQAPSTVTAASKSIKFLMFAQPMVLTRLANYLMDWHRHSGQWSGSKALPLILCAQDSRTNMYTIVGQEYPEHAGALMPNKLGKYFQIAADSLNQSANLNDEEDETSDVNHAAQEVVRLDYSFDSHVVQVASKDIQPFIEQLHYLMDASV